MTSVVFALAAIGMSAFSLTGYGDQAKCPLPAWPRTAGWVGLGSGLVALSIGIGAGSWRGDDVRLGTKLSYVAVLLAVGAILALSQNVCGPD